MMALLTAIAVMTVLSGVVLAVAGLMPSPLALVKPRRVTRLHTLLDNSRLTPAQQRRRHVQTVVGLLGGLLAWWLSGWLIAVILIPVAVIGLPELLRPPPTKANIDKLAALESWTRSLAGAITGGVGIQTALATSLTTAPGPIKPQVRHLCARLASRWATSDALRAFGDDLDDAVGDLVTGALLISVDLSGTRLAAVLDGLAESVAEEVRMRRSVEAERNKPRATARALTVITVAVLAGLFLLGSYLDPLKTGIGQVVLLVLVAAFAASLAWMRAMTVTPPPPRFLPGHTTAVSS